MFLLHSTAKAFTKNSPLLKNYLVPYTCEATAEIEMKNAGVQVLRDQPDCGENGQADADHR